MTTFGTWYLSNVQRINLLMKTYNKALLWIYAEIHSANLSRKSFDKNSIQVTFWLKNQIKAHI